MDTLPKKEKQILILKKTLSPFMIAVACGKKIAEYLNKPIEDINYSMR